MIAVLTDWRFLVFIAVPHLWLAIYVKTHKGLIWWLITALIAIRAGVILAGASLLTAVFAWYDELPHEIKRSRTEFAG